MTTEGEGVAAVAEVAAIVAPEVSAAPAAETQQTEIQAAVTETIAPVEQPPVPVASPVMAAPEPVVAAPEPIVVAAPAVPEPAPVIEAAKADIGANLEQAGLVLIETAADKAKTVEPVFVPAQPLGRKPKPVMVIPDEPLQIVETRRE